MYNKPLTSLCSLIQCAPLTVITNNVITQIIWSFYMPQEVIWKSERMRERENERERRCVCVCVRERERERGTKMNSYGRPIKRLPRKGLASRTFPTLNNCPRYVNTTAKKKPKKIE
jgi:hypothetical protein